ncbi:STE/STE20/FRAY protein kinase [Coprinopsis sp. MPI-PUGE-AT-0042]|nr:STE/STE20/FRAY protein kinase [Coprinopsis sp. MPI-PUGE-AT-0042]
MSGESPPLLGPSSGAQQQTDMGQPPKFIGAVKDEWQLFSDRAEDYTKGEPIGFGASSIVYQATYKPYDDPAAQSVPCALKVLDLDSLPPRSLQLLQRETTLMSLSKHPNVLRVRGSWMEGHKLYIALRLMNKGSAADVMRYGWPGGMEEEVVKCILRQALKGLNYLHINGFIHRDIKAANLLIDDDGTVLLGDLGVAADLTEDPHHHISSNKNKSVHHATSASVALTPQNHFVVGGSNSRMKETPAANRPKIGKRKSFVGTPCWMAPELIQGKQYDASADIWSFGVTALELAQGHPPRFRESPQRVLLRTLQEDPPTLDRDGGTYKYSRAFKDMIDSCLLKDPSKRPTAEQLLQSPFLRSAKKKSYLVNAILKDLPPLAKRQERRALQSPGSPGSIDSWDFSHTLVSPTTSMHRYHTLQEMVADEDRRHHERESSRGSQTRNRSLSLDREHEPVFEMDDSQHAEGKRPHFEVPLDNVEEQQESDENDAAVTDTSSSDSPAVIGSPVARSITGTSSTGTSGTDDVSREASTAPSSYVAPTSSFGHDGKKYRQDRPEDTISPLSDNLKKLGTEAPSSSGPASGLASSSPPDGPAAASPALHRVISESQANANHSVKKKDSSIWRKLKGNLKKGDESTGVSPGTSPDKTSKLGSLFSSGSVRSKGSKRPGATS